MKKYIIAAAIAVVAGLAASSGSRADTCYTNCTTDYNGGQHCTTQCF